MVPLGKNRADETLARTERVERERRERFSTASSEYEARGDERRRKARFLVMRTVGRQAVCRDTGIPHYFDRGRRREVVVVTVPGADAEETVPCISLVGLVCCHLDTVLVD